MKKKIAKNVEKRGRKKGKTNADKYNIYIKFCEWFFAPASEREGISTQGEFAEKYKVNMNTISRWKKRDDFKVIIKDKRKAWGQERTGNVVASLYKRIIKYGMAYDVELWLALIEGWDKKKVTELREKLEIGDDDIRSLIKYLPKDKQTQFYDTITKLLAEARRAKGNADSLSDDDI